MNKSKLENESVFVLEQFPGLVHYEDISHYIQKVNSILIS